MKNITIPEGTEITYAKLTDLGICPSCYNREHDYCLSGDETKMTVFENKLFKCILVDRPRAPGHAVIVSQEHYKDMMDIPDELCREAFLFAKKAMNVIREVYGAESVYLCTMCDGPMNHFHLQLIPRYRYEKRGSTNFVKPRMDYVEDKEKTGKIENNTADCIIDYPSVSLTLNSSPDKGSQELDMRTKIPPDDGEKTPLSGGFLTSSEGRCCRTTSPSKIRFLTPPLT